jgi:lipoyl(octanoyl) transferase
LKVSFCILEKMDYNKALTIQELAFNFCSYNKIDGCIFFVEHPPVITLGKNASIKNILLPEWKLKQLGFSIIRAQRGGEATMHMPGQLVVYPVLNLKKLCLGVKDYVRKLENIIIATLIDYKIKSETNENYPGVWIGEKKICSLGIRIKKGVSSHGFALNYSNDISLFKYIIPCGITDKKITSMYHELQATVNPSLLREKIMLNFKKEFSFSKNKVVKASFFQNLLS